MNKEYMLVIFNDNEKYEKHYFCNTLKDVENILYKTNKEIENFRVFKQTDAKEDFELLKLCASRLFK